MQDLFTRQKAFFKTQATKEIQFRQQQLQQLKQVLQNNEQALYQAIYSDFRKSEFDTYTTELGLVYHELDLAISQLAQWSKPKKVRSGWANFPAKSYILKDPYGTCLVIGAWNYPIQLALIPVISAMAAGNTVIIKPSEMSSEVSKVLAEIISQNFKAEYLCVVEGGVQETTDLLALPFDKIFFTGSTRIGKIVYQAAAKNLTPVTLELGGKSPAIIMEDAHLKIAAKRLVWSKFINAGQTCVAPDYLLVQEDILPQFTKLLIQEIEEMYASSFDKMRDNYTQIISKAHTERLAKFIQQNEIIHGGQVDVNNRFVAPTLLCVTDSSAPIMQEEIFGPLLPIFSYKAPQDVVEFVRQHSSPLSLYLYGKNKTTLDYFLKTLSFGGGAINDSVVHLANSNLPFGGVGNSGLGQYHGVFGFEAFSHQKSILHKSFWLETPLKYWPYSNKKLNWIKKLLN